MRLSEIAQITAPMARFVSGLARDATLYYEAADRLQRLCDRIGVAGIDEALQFGHVSELADFVALTGRLPESRAEMIFYRVRGVEGGG